MRPTACSYPNTMLISRAQLIFGLLSAALAGFGACYLMVVSSMPMETILSTMSSHAEPPIGRVVAGTLVTKSALRPNESSSALPAPSTTQRVAVVVDESLEPCAASKFQAEERARAESASFAAIEQAFDECPEQAGGRRILELYLRHWDVVNIVHLAQRAWQRMQADASVPVPQVVAEAQRIALCAAPLSLTGMAVSSG